MNVKKYTPGGKQQSEIQSPPHTEATLDVIPKVQSSSNDKDSKTGVSTKNALSGTIEKSSRRATNSSKFPRWYVLRTTYGREQKAHTFITQNKGISFCPTTKVMKEINGKRKEVQESLIPNLLFAYGTEKEIQRFVYDNVHLSYVRFYYHQVLSGTKIVRKPMTVPDVEMESFRIICEQKGKDILIEPTVVPKFQDGQKVIVTEGPFAGVIGRVARYQGQQRVGVVIKGLLTIATAYIPSAFLKEYQ